jgi:hypothetical protein
MKSDNQQPIRVEVTVKRQRTLLVVVIILVGLWLGDKILISPLTSLWTRRQEAIKALDTKVKSGKRLIQRGNYVRSEWQQMQNNTLPNNDSLAQEQLLSAVHQWEQDSGVTINGIVPQWKDGEDYRTIVCRIDAVGPVSTLAHFIYDVEKGPLGVRVESLDATSRDPNGQQIALGLQISGLVLATPGTSLEK